MACGTSSTSNRDVALAVDDVPPGGGRDGSSVDPGGLFDSEEVIDLFGSLLAAEEACGLVGGADPDSRLAEPMLLCWIDADDLLELVD